MHKRLKPSLLLMALAAAGCSSIVPRSVEEAAPNAQIASAWPAVPASPAPPAASAAASTASNAAATDWRRFITDARLAQTIEAALANNRDLRQAVLHVERARAAQSIQAAQQWPTVAAVGQGAHAGGVNRPTTHGYQATVGITAFELDLFGRISSLNEAAVQSYFASDANRRAAEVALVAQVASTWLTLAAEHSLLDVSSRTLASQEQSAHLAEQRHRIGVISGLDLAQAQTQLQLARSDAAATRGRMAQTTNLLTLLVGQPLAPEWLPGKLDGTALAFAPTPAGIPSQVLMQRPDVQAAEHNLKAAGANIAAARAAYFPTIALTGAVGVGSSELGNLFQGASRIWSFIPTLTLPLFDGGRRDANLNLADINRQAALAAYEQAIQNGFREVADALAAGRSTAEQLQAQEALLQATTRAAELAEARYQAGRDSALTLLDAQRSLYAAQLGLVSLQLAQQQARLAAWRALGGGGSTAWPL